MLTELKDIKSKMILTGGIILAVILMYVTGFGCVFKRLTGIPCHGCGMTRAVLAALRLDFRAAFEYHAMFWSLPLMYLTFLFDLKPFRWKYLNWTINGLIVVGFMANWIWHLTVGPRI